MTDWKPTKNQIRALEAAQEIGLNRTISAICTDAGISRNTLYRWLKNDKDFKAAWDDVWRGSIRRHLPGVVTAQIHWALKGNTAAARLLADLAGIIKQRHEIESLPDLNIQLVWDDAEGRDLPSETT